MLDSALHWPGSLVGLLKHERLPRPTDGSDAQSADRVEIEATLPTRPAFEHAAILGDAVTQVRRRVEYTTLALKLCPICPRSPTYSACTRPYATSSSTQAALARS